MILKKLSLFLLVCILFQMPLSVQASTVPEIANDTQQQASIDEIEAVVAAMQEAVIEGDGEAYLENVDLSDKNFANEQASWVRDWAEADEDFLTLFKLEISDLNIEDNIAIGSMDLTWDTIYDHRPLTSATYDVYFVYDEDTEQWLYAGEYWVTIETDHFLVHATPELADTVEILLPQLPEIYDTVTADFDYEPNRAMEIKLYNSWQPLLATTVLSLPNFSGWNEPGESLKLIGNNINALGIIVAHEFTHFLTFDQADHEQPLVPWWLNEGIATYLSVPFDPTEGQRYYNNYLVPTRELAEDDELAPWEAMEDFWETDVQYWQYAYPQGYSFVSFVTDVYGEDLRNEWIASMATEYDVREATEIYFEMSFDDLEAEFITWIVDQ